MTPDEIDALADKADPNQYWKHPGMEILSMPQEHRDQMMMGVYLRRYADQQRDLARCLEQQKSWLITPFGSSTTARRMIDTPEDHARLRERSASARKQIDES